MSAIFSRILALPVLLLALWVTDVQAQNSPNFSATPTLEAGTALQQGAIYRFAGVLPGIDARVTLATFTGGATLETVDNNVNAPVSFPERLQPVIRCPQQAGNTCWIRFNITFVTAGTNTTASLKTVQVSAQDVDGSDGTNGTTGIREFVEFIGANAVNVATPTLLTGATALGGGTRFIQGSSANVQAGIGTDNQYEIYARYNNPVSTISIIGGATQGTSTCNPAVTNSCNRLNSYTFSPTEANLPSVTIRKTSNGAVGIFSFIGNNGFDPETITTLTSGTARAAQTQPLDAANTLTTLTEETPPAGFRLASITCTGQNPAGTATVNIPGNGSQGGTVTLNAAATAIPATGIPPSITCDFVNNRQPTVTVRKITLGAAGGPFVFEGTNGFTQQAITTTAQNTPTAGATQALTTASTATTITESPTPAGFVLTNIVCTGLGAGGTATYTVSGAGGGNVVLSAQATAPGSNIVCDFTNTALGSITIIKDAQPDNAQDFAFVSAESPLLNFSLDDDADGTLPNSRTFTNLSPGSYTVTESVVAGWTLASITCVDSDNGTVVNVAARSAVIDLDPGQAITCTFVNGATGIADLQIVKTDNATQVVSGGTTTYVLTVTNNGPAAVNGAVVRDTPGSGLNCPPANPVTCSPAAACPAGTTVSTLTGSGVTLGSIANGGVVTLSFTCNIP